MSLTEQEGALRRERSMSGRASVLAAPSREPSYRDRDGLSGRVAGGSQRPRQQAKKHPEPLRRAVADCLSSSHHVSPTEALRTVQVLWSPASQSSCWLCSKIGTNLYII